MGHYFIFEGSDGVGKTTMTSLVYKYLINRFNEERVVYTRHPGSTKVGQELRHLVKHADEDVIIDSKTERMIMACDNCAFIEQILRPAMEQNKIVVADRSNFISDYPYGMASGVDPSMMDRIHKIFGSVPKADLAIIYRCPWEIAKTRMFGDIEDGQKLKCRIESRGDEYFEKVISHYDMIVSGESINDDLRLRDIVFQYTNRIEEIDSTQPLVEVQHQTLKMVDDILAAPDAK